MNLKPMLDSATETLDEALCDMKYPQLGEWISVSFPAAFVTSAEKTPATAKRSMLQMARMMKGKLRTMDLAADFLQCHAN